MGKGSSGKMKVSTEISAGGVMFRCIEGRIEVVLIKVKTLSGNTVWALPKGHVERGEKLEEAAVREVQEETGCKGKIKTLLDKIEYWYVSKEDGKGLVKHHKFVYHYLIEYEEGNVEDHDYEVEEARWFDIDTAISLATYKKEKEVLQKAKEYIHAGECKQSLR